MKFIIKSIGIDIMVAEFNYILRVRILQKEKIIINKLNHTPILSGIKLLASSNCYLKLTLRCNCSSSFIKSDFSHESRVILLLVDEFDSESLHCF